MITVKDITSPKANAGSDLTVVEGAVVTFNGSQSMDNTGTQGLTFYWTFTIDDEFMTLRGMNTNTTISTPGTYLVTLNVSDRVGNWDIDTMVVTVLADSDGDRIPDKEDLDDDNDMVPDTEDDFPLDPDIAVEPEQNTNTSRENEPPLVSLLIPIIVIIIMIIVVLLLLLLIIRRKAKTNKTSPIPLSWVDEGKLQPPLSQAPPPPTSTAEELEPLPTPAMEEVQETLPLPATEEVQETLLPPPPDVEPGTPPPSYPPPEDEFEIT